MKGGNAFFVFCFNSIKFTFFFVFFLRSSVLIWREFQIRIDIAFPPFLKQILPGRCSWWRQIREFWWSNILINTPTSVFFFYNSIIFAGQFSSLSLCPFCFFSFPSPKKHFIRLNQKTKTTKMFLLFFLVLGFFSTLREKQTCPLTIESYSFELGIANRRFWLNVIVLRARTNLVEQKNKKKAQKTKPGCWSEELKKRKRFTRSPAVKRDCSPFCFYYYYYYFGYLFPLQTCGFLFFFRQMVNMWRLLSNLFSLQKVGGWETLGVFLILTGNVIVSMM